jgi:DNA-binding transcriptional ArsR family regulator
LTELESFEETRTVVERRRRSRVSQDVGADAGPTEQVVKKQVRRTVVLFRDAGGAAGDEPVVLENAAAVQALGDPLRLRLLKLLAEPASAKELADEVDRPVTSLYHHLDLLEQHGLIAVASVDKQGRALVRRYVRTGDRFETAGALEGLDDVVAALAPKRTREGGELTRRIALAVRGALDDRGTDAAEAGRRLRLLVRGDLDPNRLTELGDRLQAVLGEFFDDHNDDHRGATYEAAITVAPATEREEEGT